MPAVGTSVFTEPDAYEAGFRGAPINLVLTRGGEFTARLTRVALPNLQLIDGQDSLPRIAWIAPARELACVAFPTQFDPPVMWNGVELQSGDIVLQGRGARGHQRTSGTSHWAYIWMAPEHLAGYGKALTGRALVMPRWCQVLRPPPRAAARLRRLHEQACHLVATRPKIAAHRQVARALHHDLFHALVDCLTAGQVRSNGVASRRHATIMNRFEKLLASQIGRQLTAARICTSIDVSERTLRVCCAQFLGMGPSRYIRLRRLNLVRAALRRADPATTSVAELAGRYGFFELGRFAIRYRTLFGELPSATLRRRGSGMIAAPSAKFANSSGQAHSSAPA
jgi:AraC-like DNA-binding protein